MKSVFNFVRSLMKLFSYLVNSFEKFIFKPQEGKIVNVFKNIPQAFRKISVLFMCFTGIENFICMVKSKIRRGKIAKFKGDTLYSN